MPTVLQLQSIQLQVRRYNLVVDVWILRLLVLRFASIRFGLTGCPSLLQFCMCWRRCEKSLTRTFIVFDRLLKITVLIQKARTLASKCDTVSCYKHTKKNFNGTTYRRLPNGALFLFLFHSVP